MGYRAEHFYRETQNKARAEKIGGPSNSSRTTNHENVLAILSSVFEFVQEGNRFVNKLL